MRSIYKIMFFFSLTLMLAAFAVSIILGLNLGVDFKGGSVLEVSFKNPPGIRELQSELSDAGFSELIISPTENGGFILKTKELTEEEHQNMLGVINDKFLGLEEKKFDSVGPVIGQELKQKSIYAIIFALLGIILYIAIVFRKLSNTLSSWAMSMAAIVALIHDLIIPIGVFALLGKYFGIEVSAVFVAAALTILGYSISDTVVIFDRVRENILRGLSKDNFSAIVHKSIMQTLVRSLNTTFTTLFALFAIFFFGGESMKYFSLALIIGIFLGAYSSIFVASPLLVWWQKKK